MMCQRPPLHQPLDAREQGGLVFLDPLVEDDLIVVENKPGELLDQVGRAAKRGNRFCRALLPLPEPNRIEMSVADQVNSSLTHAYPLNPPQPRPTSSGENTA